MVILVYSLAGVFISVTLTWASLLLFAELRSPTETTMLTGDEHDVDDGLLLEAKWPLDEEFPDSAPIAPYPRPKATKPIEGSQSAAALNGLVTSTQTRAASKAHDDYVLRTVTKYVQTEPTPEIVWRRGDEVLYRSMGLVCPNPRAHTVALARRE